MRRLLLTISAVIALLSASALAVDATRGSDHKVDICHRTASDTNPYVYISVDVASLPAHLNDLPGHPAKQWKSDGTFRGVAHVAGDAKRDYLADSSADCTEVLPSTQPSDSPTSEPSVMPSDVPTPSDVPSTPPSSSPSQGVPSTAPSAMPSVLPSMPPTDTEDTSSPISSTNWFVLFIAMLVFIGVLLTTGKGDRRGRSK